MWPLIKHKVKDPSGLLKTIGLTDLNVDSSTASLNAINQTGVNYE